MKNHILVSLLVALSLTLAGTAAAHEPSETVEPNFSHIIPNIPGKSLIAVEVSYLPGGASKPHFHAQSAFIYAYVVSGHIVSQVKGEPERVYAPGESFFEAPGAHHLTSRNASNTEPAKLLAVFVVDTDDTELTTPDK
ncbi:cupin domain-containing protein [Pseudomonas sp.]|uniref:cupin domain-containing protein n=1 Tax=Pseudomonas sp. TaxID=306 RepID=UPI003A983BE8